MACFCSFCGHKNRDIANFCAACAKPLVLAERFRVVRLIGKGNMGCVYLARDLRLPGKMWAVKEMSDIDLKDPVEKQRAIANFKQEAQILAKLQHPNIPQVVDSFQQGDKHYIVTEYVDGLTLAEMLKSRGQPFAEIEVRAWLEQLCDVLSYLHTRQPPIVYRDLKPQNIMVDRSGQVKLIDFGIARFFKSGKASDTTLLGTPGYAPPEQYGQKQTDARSDIFALGITIYQLLTAYDPTQTPFNLPPIRSLAPSISPAMEEIVQRAIRLQPQDRWQSAAEIQAALHGNWSSKSQPQGAGASAGVAIAASTPQPTPYVSISPPSKRPTTRLIMAAATLTTRQLVGVLIVVSIAIAAGVWLFAPVIEQKLPFIWSNFPAFVIAGPIAYAAVRRRWVALVAQGLVTLVGWLTWWARSGHTPPSYLPLLLATCASAGVVELAMAYLPEIKGKTNPDAWQREVAWFALVAVITAIVFYSIQGNTLFALRPGRWVGSALLGVLGWFLGDLVQQWLYLRKTGIQRPGRP